MQIHCKNDIKFTDSDFVNSYKPAFCRNAEIAVDVGFNSSTVAAKIDSINSADIEANSPDIRTVTRFRISAANTYQ